MARHALAAIRHALLSLLRAGQSVRLAGLGRIMPASDAQGAWWCGSNPTASCAST
jgi:hypothetical protein